MADTPIGSKVGLTVLRDGKRVPVTVTLTERNRDAIADNSNPPQGEDAPDSPVNLGGLRVRDMTRSELTTAKLSAGVTITDVSEGSAADEAGLQAGDVVEEVGGKAVSSAADFSKAITDARKNEKRHAVLLVRRGDNSQFVPLRIKE